MRSGHAGIVVSVFEKLIWVIGGIIALGGFIVGILAISQGEVLQGLFIMIAAPFYAVMVLRLLFIAVGIHENTKRTAKAVEDLASR